MAIAETIHWKPCAEEMPDSDITVLIHAPIYADPIWMGYHDGSHWIDIHGATIRAKVTHWADLPQGPKKPETSKPKDQICQ